MSAFQRIIFIGFVFCFTKSLAIRYPGFVQNKNQWPAYIKYMATVPGGNMVLRAGGFDYYFYDYTSIVASHHNDVKIGWGQKEKKERRQNCFNARHLQINFINANLLSQPIAEEINPNETTYYNYFLGDDSNKWGVEAHVYDDIIYKDIYEGIDLIIKTHGEHVKYDIVVEPGANPDYIQIEYLGMAGISLSEGDLVVDGEWAWIREKKPIAYQWIEGVKTSIEVRYKLEGNKLSYLFPKGYDACYQLLIDPLLIFSTYTGFSMDNWGSSATPGERGALYSSGVVLGLDGGEFGSTPGVFQRGYGGNIFDIGIYKYDSLGKKLLYATFLGGSNNETPKSMVMNNNNELLIVGVTGSADFPTTNGAMEESFAGGPIVLSRVISTGRANRSAFSSGTDIFVSKISIDGKDLRGSTYLGGSGTDGVNSALDVNYGDQFRGDIITDIHNDVYIASVTSSRDIVFQNGFSRTYQGGVSDALIVKLSSDLRQMLWGSYLGGQGAEAAYTLQFDVSYDTIFVAGGTTSRDLPTSANSYISNFQGLPTDGWIAKLPSNGTTLEDITYVGGSGYDQVYFIDVDENGFVYAYGQTTSNMPITTGLYGNPNSGQFLQKISNDLSQLIFSTTFGSGRSSIDISPTAFLVSKGCNNIYMTGWGGDTNVFSTRDTGLSVIAGQSSTIGLPVTPTAFQSTTSGSDFYFIVLDSDAKELLYATFMGGSVSSTHVDGGTSRFDKNGIVYHAVCAGCGGGFSDFPSTEGAWSRFNGSHNCNNATFKFDLSTLQAEIATDKIKICDLAPITFTNNSLGGEFYEWDFGDGTQITLATTDDVTHNYQQPGDYTVTLKVIDKNVCVVPGKDEATLNISIYMPLGYVEGKQKQICEQYPLQLSARGGQTYLWTLEDGTSLVSEIANPVVAPNEDTKYIAHIVDVNGCYYTDTVEVAVTPRVHFDYELVRKLNCRSRIEIEMTNRTRDAQDLMLYWGDGTSTNDLKANHKYAADGIYNIRLSGYNNTQCLYEEQHPVHIYTVFVPNVITPDDSPGLNDTFEIEQSGSLLDNTIVPSVSIYNRWGKRVLENNAYKGDWSASQVSSGIYYYEVELEQGLTCRGWLNVIK